MEVSLLICLLVFLSVYLLAWHFARPKEVSLREEWSIKHAEDTGITKIVNVVIGGLVCALVAYAVTGELKFAAVGFLGGFFVANWLSSRRLKAREEMLRMQYGQVLSALASAMQGGLMHYQALEDITPTLPEPSKKVFTEILARARTGSSLYQATKEVADVVQWKDLESMAAAFKMYEATGCNLVEVFNYLADVVRERESDRKYVSAVTAQVRMTATLLSFLPFILIGVARVLSPEYTAPLFTTTGGIIVLLFCVLAVIAGNRIVNKMVEGLCV
jgi:tight adherence protein B